MIIRQVSTEFHYERLAYTAEDLMPKFVRNSDDIEAKGINSRPVVIRNMD